MPKVSRGCGFTKVKRGRSKKERGGMGRGLRGRRRASDVLVGEIEVADETIHSTHDSDSSSNQSDAFRAALLSPTPSDGSATPSDFSQFQSLDQGSDFSHDSSDASLPPTPTPPAAPELTFRVPDVPPQESDKTAHDTTSTANAPVEENPLDAVPQVMEHLKLLLPNLWISVADTKGFHVMLLSRGHVKAIQRSIYVAFDGSVEVTVHRKNVPQEMLDHILRLSGAPVSLTKSTAGEFSDRIQALAMCVRGFEVCAGAQYSDYEKFWNSDEHGYVDRNPYDETRYELTFRSNACDFLVPVSKWRCKHCSSAVYRFQKRLRETDDYDPKKPNKCLSRDEALKKLSDQHQEIRRNRRQLERLQKHFNQSLESKGVSIDVSLEERLADIFKEVNLTPLQEMFIQQQFKSASLKDKRQMRWHPTLIRFALLIKSNSSSAYRSMRDAGFIQLPGERTLFDYSHVMPRKEGCFKEKFDKISEEVRKQSGEEEFKLYHTLILDEVHISQKLVYIKSTGALVGYVSLSEAEAEMQFLTDFVKNNSEKDQPPIATKMLVYMVKGVCTKVRDVCASYTTANLTREDLYDRTWEVISWCEAAGIKIIAVVCDGSSVNRGFFQMHVPVTELDGGIVHDTINLCAPERTLYFISDGPHLLKTIRNCFSKSGIHPKCKRKLTKGGEVIAWKTIERLFMEDHDNTWRKSHKLNSQNVYLNSYTCMKVSYAAQVLSNTVAEDLRSRDWPGTAQTVIFIKKTNDFFDNINGAHTQHGKRTANERLSPFTMESRDKKFEELQDYVKYLKDWKNEIDAIPGLTKKIREKMCISHQTMEGIEITVNSIIGVVKFMHSIGAKYLNARTLNQDPLEQYFGKQRASHGGKHNPNVPEFLNADASIGIHRDMNVGKRTGNTESDVCVMELLSEPLPKRKRTSDTLSKLYARKKGIDGEPS
ncbi:Transposable element P transposase [Frankliniella fusca]|uniref:Transposable element P transposase n=1 Tax=Frankliniella fusca TaxID=407009 RepID=A0AAE1H9P5_9NEOP|nr:Transposable element P transposase [Frankliniella fusca]KAK3920731.1 Transposable element P transposase [Frankliniella fusca]